MTDSPFVAARLRELFMEFRRLSIPLPTVMRVTKKDYEQLQKELEVMARHTDQLEHIEQFIMYQGVTISPMLEE